MMLRRGIQFSALICCLASSACDPLEPCLTGLNTGDVILVEIGEQRPPDGAIDVSRWEPEECALNYPLRDALLRLSVEEFAGSRSCRSGYGSLSGLEGMMLTSTDEPNFRDGGHFFDESYSYQMDADGERGFLRLALWSDSTPPGSIESSFAGHLVVNITPDEPAGSNSCSLLFEVRLKVESP